MRFIWYGLLGLVAVCLASAADEPVSSTFEHSLDNERSFASLNFTTFTVLKSTTTLISTFTSVTTCTTSTAALSTCTKSGGRKRRGLSNAAQQGRHRRGLFFDDDEIAQDGSIFLPSEKRESRAAMPVETQSVGKDSETIVPLELQPGYSLPTDVNTNRFLLSLGVLTVTSYTITTSTTSLTAICKSTTGWSLCGASGK